MDRDDLVVLRKYSDEMSAQVAALSLERRPIHPGEMLREEFLAEYGLTVSGLADSVGVARRSYGRPSADAEINVASQPRVLQRVVSIYY